MTHDASSVMTGTGLPVVLIHAFPLSRRMWEPNLPAFSRHFKMITPDLPGFGDSPLTGDATSMEEMARQVLKTLDGLKITEPAVMAGVSMGGYVLFQILKLAPERVRAAAFISTRAAADTPEGRDRRMKTIEMVEKEGLKPLAEKMMANLLGKSTREGKPDLVATVKNWIEGANPQGVCAALRGMAERPEDRKSVV